MVCFVNRNIVKQVPFVVKTLSSLRSRRWDTGHWFSWTEDPTGFKAVCMLQNLQRFQVVIHLTLCGSHHQMQLMRSLGIILFVAFRGIKKSVPRYLIKVICSGIYIYNFGIKLFKFRFITFHIRIYADWRLFSFHQILESFYLYVMAAFIVLKYFHKKLSVCIIYRVKFRLPKSKIQCPALIYH